MNPDIYLLDEPSSNLDIAAIEDLRKHLRLIKAQGKTILIAEHRLYYLMDIADRIIYLEEGHIAGTFTPATFQELPDNKRKAMGLRSIDLKKEKPREREPVSMEPILELKDVALSYKKRQILKQINLKAAPGEIIAVVGHNGTGKTTFSRALCGLHRDCTGKFLWKGVLQNHKARLALSYMVMQDVNYELFAESVRAECSLGIQNPSQELVADTIEQLQLTSYLDRHPNTLSGGQKQRVAVAVSMLCGKELLVFDEPTSGLDYDSMTQVAGLIRSLASSGKIIFVVTHDYEFACQSCSRLIYFDNGTLADDLLLSEQNEKAIRTIFDLEV